MARRVFSMVPKAVRRKKCSPAGPKPEPGVPTTLALSRRRSKNAQLVMSSGVLSQI